MQRLSVTGLIVFILGFASVASAAPYYVFQQTILPATTTKWELGTSTNQWLRLFAKYASTTQLSATSLCLTGDACRTTWPSSAATLGTVSTSAVPVVSGLAVWTTTTATPALLDTVATGTITGSGGITVTAGQSIIGSGLTITSAPTSTFTSPLVWTGSTNAVTCNVASGSQAGCIAVVDWSRFNSATTTFTAPLTYTGSTNAVTCTSATASVPGCLSAVNFQKFNSATTTFSAPLTYTGSTNAVTCSTCNTSNATVSSIATTWPVTGGTITTSGTIAFDGISTTSPWTIGNLAFVSSGKLLTSVATSSTGSASTVVALNASQFTTLPNASTTNLTALTSFFAGTTTLNNGIILSATQPATSTITTLNWGNSGPQIEYQIGTGAITINIINATTSVQWGSRKLVWVCNPNAVAGALTWTGVEWIGTAPTQTTTANNCDAYSFDILRATSTSAYKVAGSQGANFQ